MDNVNTLEKILQQAESATEGPWTVEGYDSGHSRYECNWYIHAGDDDQICCMDGLTRSDNELLAKDDGGDDAYFMAAARTNVPVMAKALIEIRDIALRDRGHPDVSEAVVEILVRAGLLKLQ